MVANAHIFAGQRNLRHARLDGNRLAIFIAIQLQLRKAFAGRTICIARSEGQHNLLVKLNGVGAGGQRHFASIQLAA